MICNVIDNDYYIIKIYNNYLDFDIYNHDEVGKFIEGIFKNILKKYHIKGEVTFNIYIDKLYGMIIEVKRCDNEYLGDLVDIRIKFNLNVSFLYEVDYFYLKDNKLLNQNIYYYNDRFYLEIINDIDNKDYLNLLDNSLILYSSEINNVINNGIKLANI